MSGITDPAIELAEVCAKLIVNTSQKGDVLIAKAFETEAWSTEFFRLIITIVERVDFIESILEKLAVDPMVLASANDHLAGIRKAFSREMIGAAWNTNPSGMTLLREHAPPIRMLSPTIRSAVSYPKLTTEEVVEILGMATTLTDWLREHQLQEHDSIRAALIEGLEQFSFRAKRLEWFGWGYSFDSLRAVIGAYMALDRGVVGSNEEGIAAAVVAKTGAWLKAIFEKIGVAKDVVERGQFLLAVYGGVNLVGQSGVIGLLPHANG